MRSSTKYNLKQARLLENFQIPVSEISLFEKLLQLNFLFMFGRVIWGFYFVNFNLKV